MKALLMFAALMLVAGSAMAGGPPMAEPVQPTAVPCNMPTVAYDWDFADGNQGFTTGTCDASGSPVWQHGSTGLVPGAPGTVWGTILNANYPNDAGEALKSPSFAVSNAAYLVEVYHWFQIENNYDGGNVKANGALITPQGGYTATINTSTSYYAWCVDGEMGWTGSASPQWRTDCFDLSALMGQNVELSFEFGSDSSVSYPGWYLASVMIGGEGQIPTEETSWGFIKAIYQ